MLKYLFRFFLALTVATGVTIGIGTVARGASQVCTSDNTQVCPDISMVHMKSDFDNMDVSSSGTTLYTPVETKLLTFIFTSSNLDSGKNLTIQFFDVSPGVNFIIVPSGLNSLNCDAQLTIQKQCQIKLDTNGSASFKVALFNQTEGTGFSYQLVGPTAWVSRSVTTVFTPKGNFPYAPLSCAVVTSQICAPVTNVTISHGGQILRETFDTEGNGTTTISPSMQFLHFAFTSSSAYAYKTVYVDFFNVSSTTRLSIDTSTNKQGIGCDKQVAISNGCFIKLDSSGAATFIVAILRSQLGDSFRFKLNGAGYTSQYVQVNLATQGNYASPSATPSPSPTIVAIPTISISGISKAIQISIKNSAGKTAVISGKGIRTTSLRLANADTSIIFPLSGARYSIKVVVGNLTKNVTVTVK